MVALPYHEDVNLPLVDYCLSITTLLPPLGHLRPQKCGTLAAQGRQLPPPPNATVTLCMNEDGY